MKVHFLAMGASLFRRSYRLEEESFWKLLDIIGNKMPATGVARRKNRGAVPNGAIIKEARLSMALRYFAGGDPVALLCDHHCPEFCMPSKVRSMIHHHVEV